MKRPKLRDSYKLQTSEPYPINEIPEDLIVKIGGHLVYLLYVGRKDLTGSDWGRCVLFRRGRDASGLSCRHRRCRARENGLVHEDSEKRQSLPLQEHTPHQRTLLARLFLRHHRPA